MVAALGVLLGTDMIAMRSPALKVTELVVEHVVAEPPEMVHVTVVLAPLRRTVKA